MKSEGADVNCRDIFGGTGLMGAMCNGNTEVVRVLLGCKNIKIDIKNRFGWTALHYACHNNQVESVKLFLAHPTCNKAIVRMKDMNRMTAEMVATDEGNHDCARLVREFNNETEEEDNRNVDDLVEFITGKEIERKKRKIKKKNVVKSKNTDVSGGCNSKSANNDASEIKPKDTSEKVRNVILNKTKGELEKKIAEQREYFNRHEENAKQMIDSMADDIRHVVFMMDKSRDEKNIKLTEVEKLDEELIMFETEITKLKQKKAELLEESKNDDERIHNYEYKKHQLEWDLEREITKNKERGNSIKDQILHLEIELQETEKLTHNHPNNDAQIYEERKEFLTFIDDQIIEKEKELECPVCLEVASSPIFMCSEQHLICSTCRPKLSNCPECRVVYKGKNRRHRYAEKTAEELERLKNKKDQVRKYSSFNSEVNPISINQEGIVINDKENI